MNVTGYISVSIFQTVTHLPYHLCKGNTRCIFGVWILPCCVKIGGKKIQTLWIIGGTRSEKKCEGA